jgi:ABC-type transport system involved in multi-copper enzyme maturation permease subunit
LDIKIIKFLNKYIIANLLQNRFKNWEKFAFFDLFSTKRFRIVTNLIMLNKYYKIGLKKIKLNKNYKIQPKDYEFFLTQIGDNYSIYYSFIPFIVLIVFGKKEKKISKN